MLYYLVGSRDLDGGLMCTASHNPKPTPGPSWSAGRVGPVRRRRHRRDAGADRGRPRRRRRAAARSRRSRLRGFPGRGAEVHRPGVDQAPAGRRRRRQRDGRADGGTAARAARAGSGRGLLVAGRQLSRPRAQPAAAREPRVHHAEVVRQQADLGIAWDGDADRCFFIDEHGRVRRRRLPDRAAGRVDARQAPRRRRSCTTSGPAGPWPTRRAGRRPGPDEPRRTRLLQDAGCARRTPCSAGRSPATTTSATSTARTRARSRRC